MSDEITVAEVNAAIRAVMVGGQQYTIAGRTFTRASLSELRALKKEAVRRERVANNKRIIHFDANGSGPGGDGDGGGTDYDRFF